MKTLLSILATIALTTAAYAADVSGIWKAEFDTQRGLQKYTITLKQDGATVTGKASVETADRKRDVEFKEVKVEGDTVSFVETLNAQGNELRIVYTGKISGNEIKFARKVGDISTTEAVARKDGAPAPAQVAAAQPAAALPAPKEDFKPAPSNLPGKEYPQVNSERRVRYRVVAPQATSVKVGALELAKGPDGAWMGTSEPRDEGAHFYTLNIDGAEVPDPNSMVVGANRLRSSIEVPAADRDFYALKNVPHGQMREVRYFANSSKSIRRIYVYTPPDYDKDVTKRYPVLYLQHGSGEDETMWGTQGRTGLIMDNLIAAGKAKPFIIVMEGSANTAIGPDGAAVPPATPAQRGGAPGVAPTAAGAAAPAAGATAAVAPAGRGGLNFSAFERVLIDDLIPYIDANFRTLANQANRGMAGLSLGGMQTRSIGLSHLDLFSHIGVFSGGSITAEQAAAIPDFKQKVKLVFVSYGSREIDRPAVPRGGAPGGGRGGNATTAKADIQALKQAGINAHFYVSPETAHEWQSWRRSLHELAQLLFKN